MPTSAKRAASGHDKRAHTNHLKQENEMTQQNRVPGQTGKKPSIPPTDNVAKQDQKEKAETQEIAGKHKNDGQKDHKGRR
jgi:hypothetical protein